MENHPTTSIGVTDHFPDDGVADADLFEAAHDDIEQPLATLETAELRLPT